MSKLNVYHHELRPDEYDEFYLKYEADKVIAELKADYKEACDRLQTANLIKDEQLAATRHQIQAVLGDGEVVLGRQITEQIRRPRLYGLCGKMAQALAGICREIKGGEVWFGKNLKLW